MRAWVRWLFGSVLCVVSGAQTEDFLNLCAKRGILLSRMSRKSPFDLLVCVDRRQYAAMKQAAELSGCEVKLEVKRGLPFFLLRFRRRYALMLGLLLSIVVILIGSRTVLSFEVTGNETVSSEEIISQLRLCGFAVGTYGPTVPLRTVENKALLSMNELRFLRINLHGTRAEVIVREREKAPKVLEEAQPTEVIASADGIVTHIEPWMGDPCFAEGDMVCKGEVLISGRMFLDPPPMAEAELGTMLVHAEGKVLAHTFRKLTTTLSLTPPAKAYTGNCIARRSLSVMGHRINFYRNSGIPYEKYDTMTVSNTKTLAEGRLLPLLWETETIREYSLTTLSLDRAKTEEMLKERLLRQLKQSMQEGEILKTDYETSLEGDLLSVTLSAECNEQIGRTVSMDTNERVTGPRHPTTGTAAEDTAKEQGS